MTVSASLKAAVADVYHHSWTLVVLNGALSAAVLGILLAASYVQAALVLLVLVGPLAAALAHCAVTLAETEELRLRDAMRGLRLHWRRGLQLAALGGAVLALGLFGLVFYARAGGAALPLAVLCGYLLFVLVVLQLLVWPRAVKEPDLPVTRLLADAGITLLRRPLPSLSLGLALLVVNALGALAILPLLTLTIAYSFVAAAHFALPRKEPQEAEPLWQA